MSDRGSLRRGAPIAPRVLFVTPSGALRSKPWPAAVGNFPNRSLAGFPGFPEKGSTKWHTCGGQPPGSALAARCSPWAAGGGRAPPLLLPGRYMPLVQGLRTPRKLLALAQQALFFGPHWPPHALHKTELLYRNLAKSRKLAPFWCSYPLRHNPGEVVEMI